MTWLACYRMGNRPRTENGREIAGEMATSHSRGGGVSPNGRKMAGYAENHQISDGRTTGPAIFRPFWNLSPKKMAAGHFAGHFSAIFRRRTNVQQLTCKIDLSNYFYYLFFSFVLLELKPFVLKGKVRGEKL